MDFHAFYQTLTTIPGMGPVYGTGPLAEIGPVTRFASENAWAIGIGAGFIGVGMAPGIGAALGGILLAEVFGAWAQMARMTWLAKNVRRDMLGHTYNLLNASDLVRASLGFALTGILLTRVSPAPLITGAGVLMIVGASLAIRYIPAGGP